MKKSKQAHHHGNLREALIECGLNILNKDGASALTLRACAADAGVSHAAPSHHFNGLSGLQTAIAARGFAQLSQTMIEQLETAQAGPRDKLTAICLGYIIFATRHSALMTLMFNAGLNFDDDPELKENSAKAFEILETHCAPFQPISKQQNSTEIMIWSLVHGYAQLSVGGKIKNTPSKQNLTDFENILPELKLRPSFQPA